MEDLNKHNESLDAFSLLIKRKLEQHQMSVDTDGWNQLQKQLTPQRRKLGWWWLMIGSAAVITLMFTLQPFSNWQNNREVAFETTSLNSGKKATVKVTPNPVAITNETQQIATKKVKPEIELVKSKLNSIATQSKISALKKLKSKNNIGGLNESYVQEKNFIRDTLKKEIKNPKTESSELATLTEENASQTDKQMNRKSDKFSTIENQKEPEEKQIKQKNWLLAAAFGSGGSTTLSGASDLFLAEAGDRNMVNAATNFTTILTPNDFTQKNFMAPLSFGLVIRRNITNKLAVESGIMYTYLASTFENTGQIHYDASLSLHYLGIPLNLIVPLWKKQKWEVYLSGGGMVEKGLRSVYIQRQYIGDQIITTDARTSIDGFQWSTNVAMGGTYLLNKNIGVYFEPKFSYFFNNNQPISARTDQPIVVGLTAGLRLKF